MHILALGLNHRTAPVALRERLALDGDRLTAALASAHAEAGEAVILSTCNRTEVYAAVADCGDGARALRRVLAAQTSGSAGEPADVLPHLYDHRDRAAVEHLLRVAAGLDSLVLGEPQILGQARDALAAARAAGAAGPLLSRLFHAALSAGKEARTATGIARHAASVGHAAIALARAEVGALEERRVLVLGAGKMAGLVAGAIAKRKPSDAGGTGGTLTIVNRTPERATALAERLGGQACPFEQLAEALAVADVVIASTGAPEPVLTAEFVAAVLPRRAGRPLLILDIAVPRDVEPAAGALPGVTLRNIDDLRETVAAGLSAREAEVHRVEALLERHAAAYWEWHEARAVAPTISALRAKAEAIRTAELAKALGRLGHLDERDRNTVAALSVAIANKLLHEPTMRLKQPDRGSDYARAAAELFGLAPTGMEGREDGALG